MLVDWFTIAAQLVNFVVLVAILRYFLYGRILKTVKDREEEIRSRLEEAEHQREEAGRRVEEQAQREREWNEEREARLLKAKEEAEERRRQLVEEARQEVEALRRRWHESLQDDKASFLRDLREGLATHAFDIARGLVADLADQELERQILRVFRRRLGEMNAERREALKQAAEASEDGITLVSAFEIGSEDREKLAQDLREVLDKEVPLRFETSPEVICGLELVTGDGHKIGFGLGSYLRRLEEWSETTLEAELQEQREKVSSAKEQEQGKGGDSGDESEGEREHPRGEQHQSSSTG